jgi:putative FmdB family regulatory protein
MPIYEYQCRACGHRLETIQKVSDPLLTECPRCAEPQLKKLVSAAAFRLKGGGWYETDFKSGGRKNVAGDGKGSTSENGSDSAGDKSAAAGNGAKEGSATGSSGGDSAKSGSSTGSNATE